MGGAVAVPEQGQLVRVRHRHFIVQDVWPGSVQPGKARQHRVRLEAMDDDMVGETLDVIWEHEINTVVHDSLGLPRPDSWDPAGRFEAFLLASRWSLSSMLEGLPLQAPFRGAIQIEDYQLEPVVRALRMPRVNMLLADDVGLGKTIEAGMVIQELLARQRIRRILVVCPASLQKQWAEEMISKFALRFEIVDRGYAQRLRREYGAHINPWASYPRLITSMDFLKREAPGWRRRGWPKPPPRRPSRGRPPRVAGAGRGPGAPTAGAPRTAKAAGRTAPPAPRSPCA